MKNDSLAHWLAKYFDEYLIRQRRLSRHTLHSYRDSWKLLLRYACEKSGKSVEQLGVRDAGAQTVNRFLEELGHRRSNGPSTRNVRLAAIKSFFRWLAVTEPSHLGVSDIVLSIPKAKGTSKAICYLERDELDAVLAEIETDTPHGARNYALLALMYNTGARVQEALGLRICDVQTQRPYLVKLLGKGNRERVCVLWPETAEWIRRVVEQRRLGPDSQEPLFVNRYGKPMTRHGVRYIIRVAAQKASQSQPSLAKKRLHPHVIRHTAAMHMLQSGVDIVTIQSILGHASSDTTSCYAKADLAMKRAALEKCRPLTDKPEAPRWKTEPDILAFLSAL